MMQSEKLYILFDQLFDIYIPLSQEKLIRSSNYCLFRPSCKRNRSFPTAYFWKKTDQL